MKHSENFLDNLLTELEMDLAVSSPSEYCKSCFDKKNKIIINDKHVNLPDGNSVFLEIDKYSFNRFRSLGIYSKKYDYVGIKANNLELYSDLNVLGEPIALCLHSKDNRLHLNYKLPKLSHYTELVFYKIDFLNFDFQKLSETKIKRISFFKCSNINIKELNKIQVKSIKFEECKLNNINDIFLNQEIEYLMIKSNKIVVPNYITKMKRLRGIQLEYGFYDYENIEIEEFFNNIINTGNVSKVLLTKQLKELIKE